MNDSADAFAEPHWFAQWRKNIDQWFRDNPKGKAVLVPYLSGEVDRDPYTGQPVPKSAAFAISRSHWEANCPEAVALAFEHLVQEGAARLQRNRIARLMGVR